MINYKSHRRRQVSLIEKLFLVIIVLLAAVALLFKPYSGHNVGIVWDNVMGVEIIGDPGLFVCPGTILSDALPSFVIDC